MPIPAVFLLYSPFRLLLEWSQMPSPLTEVQAAVETTDHTLKFLGALGRWLRAGWRWFHPIPPLDIELIPIRFEITLTTPYPVVTIYLKVANFTTRSAHVRSLMARSLHLRTMPDLSGIPALDEFQVPPHSSQWVMLQRTLVESEIAAARDWNGDDPPMATVSFVARGRLGHKDFECSVTIPYDVPGVVHRPSSR